MCVCIVYVCRIILNEFVQNDVPIAKSKLSGGGVVVHAKPNRNDDYADDGRVAKVENWCLFMVPIL